MIEIPKERCKVWKASLLAPPVPGTRKAGANTQAKKLACVSHFLKWSVANDYLDRNPMEGLQLNSRLMAASKTPKAGLSEEQLAHIFRNLTPFKSGDQLRVEFFWLVLCLAFTGARLTEILQLFNAPP